MHINNYAYGADEILTDFKYSSPIYQPKKHTVESYRKQQRKAKKRKSKY